MDVQEVFNKLNNNNVNELIDQMGIVDPRMKMIMQFMNNQNIQNNECISDFDEVEDKNINDATNIEELSQENRDLKDENSILIERNDLLAAALGACPDCWGENDLCEVCNGEGHTGYYLPEKKLFSEFVLPVVRNLKLYKKQTNDKDSNINLIKNAQGNN